MTHPVYRHPLTCGWWQGREVQRVVKNTERRP